MSRKQNQFLKGVLSDTGDEVPARAQRPNLLIRETALGRLASGEVRQVTELRLDPSRCRIWEGNARYYASLTEDTCRDLIDSMIAEGGQRVPAFVRHVKDDPEHDYEVLVGARRHWSVSWMRSHNYPDVAFVAHVQDLDDEAAFRLADLENRARADLSDLERARNYAQALQRHYGGVQSRMAERLRVSKGWLTKILALAQLPDGVVTAYPTPASIQVKGGYELTVLLADRRAADLITAAANLLAEEQERRRRSGEALIPGPEVTRQLLESAREKRGRRIPVPILSQTGRPLLSIISDRADGLTLRVHANSGADEAEIAARVSDAVRIARMTRVIAKK
jgi:ParB family transcriptional regulator, chromosome partitioning protein